MDAAKKYPQRNDVVNENDLRFIKSKFNGTTQIRELLLNEIKSLYYIEKVLLKAFPKMIKNACSFELIEAITIHYEETKNHILRLEDAFLCFNENPTLQRNQAIECLIDEIDSIVDHTKFGSVRDAGIILNLSKIEHYEIATYNVLSTYAATINENAIAELLAVSLNEEKVTELRLNKIADAIRFETFEF